LFRINSLCKDCGDHVCQPGEIYPPEPIHNTQNVTIPFVPQGISQDITSENNTIQNIPSPPLPSKLPSPQKQLVSGVSPTNIKCAKEFSLVLNLLDSRHACIKSEDLTKFVARGGGKEVKS
jgi:hypothetical protein